jgi:mannan endo-1,4-beta-mannosidase
MLVRRHSYTAVVSISLILLLAVISSNGQSPYISVRGHALIRNNGSYRFVGANYWYGSLLALDRDPKRGLLRLRRELDFLKAHGITNVRLMAGAEGSGRINGVSRVGPPLQPAQGKFDEQIFEGLDRILLELGRRGMTAVIFLSNNWEWSGGFQQYLFWNGLEPSRLINDKPSWDEYRDLVSQFYTCDKCKSAYRKQVETILSHTNKFSGGRYADDPAIMAWELANEPRPMRPSANNAYLRWVNETAEFIKSIDKKHLVTIGTEGWIGTQDIKLFEDVNADKNIDYLTIHIWPKNWEWFSNRKIAESFPNILAKTDKYISENVAVAIILDKPLIIEEFGLPRDGIKFDAASPTTFRDRYYEHVLSFIAGQPGGSDFIAGANFWAFGGTARPIIGQTFWKPGDEYLGDPPMEEQGLNTVYTADRSTWNVIMKTASTVKKR